jgi:hypothetical protein
MKKLLKIVVILGLLGVIALVTLGFFLGPIVTKAVNTVGPKVTGTRVELDAAKVSPLTGGAELAGLFVGNPDGWTEDKAIYLGKVRVSMQPMSLLGDAIKVNEVFIDGPEFVYEKRLLGGSNIDALLKQIEANMGGGAVKPAGEPVSQPAVEEAAGKPMKFMVKSFVLQNARMSLVLGGQTLSVPLPPLTLIDLGVEEGGITADQVATRVLSQVLGQMVNAAADKAAEVGGAALKGGAEGAKGAAQGIFDRLRGK